jgi:hypothetical protein
VLSACFSCEVRLCGYIRIQINAMTCADSHKCVVRQSDCVVNCCVTIHALVAARACVVVALYCTEVYPTMILHALLVSYYQCAAH